ncbi:MAG: glycosyl hydrolase [Armatimonadota bacterium]
MKVYRNLVAVMWLILAMLSTGAFGVANIPSKAKPVAATTDLETGFRKPTLATAPWVYWRWPGNVSGPITNEMITADLEAMKAQGIGGVMIDNVGPILGVPYLSEAHLALIRHARIETLRLGIGFYVHNCAGWATSGGPWITAENSMKQLCFARVVIKGPQSCTTKLPEPASNLGFYRDIAVLAAPTSNPAVKPLNLSNMIDSSGTLRWDVPAGERSVLRIGYTTTGSKNSVGDPVGTGLECDKLSAQGIEAHFKGIAPLLRAMATEDTNHKSYIGADSWECGPQNWTESIPAEFKARTGYDIIPWMPYLVGQAGSAAEQGSRFNEDLADLMQDMTRRNYIGRMTSLAHEHGMLTECESSPEAADVPMGEFWAVSQPETVYGPYATFFKDDPLRSIAVPNNVAPLARGTGHNVIAQETLTSRSQNWERAPSALKSGIDWALCGGYNKMVFHLYAIQADTERKPGYMEHGTAVNRNLTWWNQAHAWFGYIARCQYMLRQGVHVSDVCYIGDSDAEESWSDGRFQEQFPAKYRYDVALPDRLATRMKVKDGCVVTLEGASYRLIVLPNRTDISLKVLRRVRELVSQGAVVLGSKPVRARGLAGFPSSDIEVQRLAKQLWGDSTTPKGTHKLAKGRVLWGMSVTEALASLGAARDFRCELLDAADRGIDWVHRKIGGTDIYFVVNRAGYAVNFDAFFRVTGKAPELWNPDSTAIEQNALYELKNGETRLPLRLNPYESLFVVFRRSAGDHFIDAQRVGARRTEFGLAANDVVKTPAGSILATTGQAGRYQLTTASGSKLIADVPKPSEPIHINGPWSVSFINGLGAPSATTFNHLISWTEHDDKAIKYYSGSAVYSSDFNVPKNWASAGSIVMLDLGDLRELADVTLNGQSLATLWRPPFRVDISKVVKTGSNHLQVLVVNTWLNRYVGDRGLPPEQRVTVEGPACSAYTATTLLPQSGLLGPVVISSEPHVKVNIYGHQ